MTQAPARKLADFKPDARFAWCVTGSGHLLEESIELALALPRTDLFLSAAAEEVLPLYGWKLPRLRERFNVFRDKSASGVPVGMLYHGMYHTVIIAPATSNTVAKCAFGISDTLPTQHVRAGRQAVHTGHRLCMRHGTDGRHTKPERMGRTKTANDRTRQRGAPVAHRIHDGRALAG